MKYFANCDFQVSNNFPCCTFFHFSKDPSILYDILWLFGWVFRRHVEHIPDHRTRTRKWPQDDRTSKGETRFVSPFCVTLLSFKALLTRSIPNFAS